MRCTLHVASGTQTRIGNFRLGDFMNWESIARNVDASAAQAFVQAARHVVDALQIEGQRVRETQTPGAVDYETAGLSRAAPAGGWISSDELRAATQRMAEAIAAEKWIDGMVTAIRIFMMFGGAL